MKIKIILLCSFAFVLLGNVNAQTAFAPIGAEWYFAGAAITPKCLITKVEKDTVIDGKTCSVVGNRYLYQEDNKVYLRYNNVFYKVFDFTVEVGDSVQLAGMLYNDSLITVNCKVRYIDTITDNNSMLLKRIGIECAPSDYWYGYWYYSYAEKLGTLDYGSIIPLLFVATPDIEYPWEPFFINGSNHLIAYKDNMHTIVNVKKGHHSTFPCDFPGKETAVTDADYSSVKIFPNPVSNMFEIQYLDNAAYISLTDVFGRIIQKYKISSSNLKIDVSFLPAGIYFCKIYNSDSLLLTHKIIKI